ncbi:MAG TPA: hypothetical protein VIH93_08210 [Thermoanaerobaculia bacterium]|jgi:hypothetical protein
MRRRSAEAGSGNLGCILWVALLAIAVLAAWKMIPVKVRSAELYDHMVEITKFGAHSSPEDMEKDILNKARELDLPLDKDHVKVERIGDRVKMEASYDVPIDFVVHTFIWHFDHQVDRPLFIF